MSSKFIEGYWTEKYRPKFISEELVLNDELKSKFNEYIKTQQMPHLLFVGPPGTGKTTVSMSLIRSIIKSESDVLLINGSVDNGVDVIRDRIMPFLNTPPSISPFKIVFIDECDFMSINAFASLRATIEQPMYNKNLITRFLFTANYINKIPTPILSRFTVFQLNSMPREEVYKRCIDILENENINYSEKAVNNIIDNNYPDMRSIIKVLQASSQNSVLNESTIIETPINNIEKLICNIISSNNFQECMNLMFQCHDMVTDEIDVQQLITKLLDRYVDDFYTHTILFRYYNMECKSIIPRHTLIAMVHQLFLNKFDIEIK